MFLDQAMDGEAISQALGTLPGPDCLKDVVPKFGVRLKVYNAIRSFMRSDESDSEVMKLSGETDPSYYESAMFIMNNCMIVYDRQELSFGIGVHLVLHLLYPLQVVLHQSVKR